MSGLYLCGRQSFGEGLDWREADVKVALVSSSYSFSEKHSSVAKIPTVGDPQDVWGREIPNGCAMVDDDPVVFDTPRGEKVDGALLFVDDTPIAFLKLADEILTNGGEVEVALPKQVFAL